MRLPPGYGAIIKLNGKRRKKYNARVTIINEKGESIRKSLGCFKTKREALHELELFNSEPYDLTKNKFTFEDVYDLWLKDNTLAESTKRTYIQKYNKYCPPLYKKEYKRLNTFHFQEIVNSASDSVSNKNKLVKFLRSMGRTAVKYDIVNKDYTQFLKTEHIVHKEKQPFSEDEIKKLWNSLDVPNVNYILVHIYTGFRPNEFVNVKVNNIDLEKGIIIGGGKTKAGTNRRVPIHEKIKPLIKDIIKDGREKLFRFTDKAYRERFKNTMKVLNMNHTPHECRHTLRTRLDNLETNVVIMNKIMGHSSGNIGDSIYTHKTDRQLIEAINKLD